MSNWPPATRLVANSTTISSAPEVTTNNSTVQATKLMDSEDSGREVGAREVEEEEEESFEDDNEPQENLRQAVHLDPDAPSRRLFSTQNRPPGLESLGKKLKAHGKLFNKSPLAAESGRKSRRRKLQRTNKSNTQRQALTSTAGYAGLAATGSYEPSLLASAYGKPLAATLKQHFPSLAAPLNLTSAVQRLIMGKFSSQPSNQASVSGAKNQLGSLAASSTPPASVYEHQFPSFDSEEDFGGWGQLPARDPFAASYSAAASSPLAMAEPAKSPAIPVEIIGLDPAVTNSILFGGGGDFFGSPGTRSPSPSDAYANGAGSRYPDAESSPAPKAPSVLHVHHFHMPPKRPQSFGQAEQAGQTNSDDQAGGEPANPQQQQVFVNDKGELVYLAVENQSPEQQQQSEQQGEPEQQPEVAPAQPPRETEPATSGQGYPSNHQPAGANQEMVMVAYKPANQSTSYNDGQESKASSVSTRQLGAGQNATSKLVGGEQSFGGDSPGSAMKMSRPKPEQEENPPQRVPLNSNSNLPMSSAMLQMQMQAGRPMRTNQQLSWQPPNGYTGTLPAGFKNISAMLQQRPHQQQQSVIESLALLRRLQQQNQQHQLMVQQGTLLPGANLELVRHLLARANHNNQLQQQQHQKFEMTQASDQLPSKFLRSQLLQPGAARNNGSNFLREHQFYSKQKGAGSQDRKLPVASQPSVEPAGVGGADAEVANLTLAFALMLSLLALTILAVFLFYRHRRRSVGRCANLPGRSRLNLTQRTKHFMRSNFVKPNEVTAIKSLSLESGARLPANFGQEPEETRGEGSPESKLNRRLAAGNKTKTFGAQLSSFGQGPSEPPEARGSPAADIRTLNTKLHQPKPSYLKSLISAGSGELSPEASCTQPGKLLEGSSSGYLNVAGNAKQKAYARQAKVSGSESRPRGGSFKRLANGAADDNPPANYSSFMGANFGKPQPQAPEANANRRHQPVCASRMSTIHSPGSAGGLETERELARAALARVGLRPGPSCGESMAAGSGGGSPRNFPPLPTSAHKLSRQLQQARGQAQAHAKHKISELLQADKL